MISIGFVGEQYARSPIIDISEYLMRWPGSYPQLFVQRPNENEAYIATISLNQENGTIVWEVNAYDTAVEGRGRAQLVFTKSETDKTIVGKSPVIQTYVQKSLEGTGKAEIPDPYETWVATIAGYADHAAASAALSENKASESTLSASEASTQANNARQYAASAKESAENSQENRVAAESARNAAQEYTAAAGNAAGKAETAKTGADEARETAIDAAARASASAESAVESARSSQDAKTASQDASTAALSARDDARGYSTTAETASNSAEAAKRIAEECSISASQSKEIALSAKSDAESAEAAAENAKTMAETAKTQAESAKADAESAKTAAENARTLTETAKTQAESAKVGAESAKDNAEGYAQQSEAWACETINGEPIPASESQYQKSAKHYANVASDSAIAAQTAAGHYPYIGNNGNWYVWDVSTDAYMDTGHAAQGPAGETQDISGKADKVFNAISGNLAALDGNGNLTDSKSKPSDFLTEHQDISGKQTKITANGILKGDGNGNVSAATPGTDYGTYSKPVTGIPATDLAEGVIPVLTDLIDDTARDGDADKVWSADKSDEEISQLSNEVNNVQNEVADLRNDKAPIIFDTASGVIASFPDGADDLPLEHLVANIEPVQDLHGYDNPWPSGGGKNLILFSDEAIVSQQYCSTSYANNGVVVTSTSQYGRAGYSFAVTSGKTYTISFKAKKTGAVQSLKFNNAVAWGDTAYGTIGLSVETLTAYTKTITADTDILFIGIYPNDNGNIIELQDVMLEEGSSATTFAPYSNICPITGWTGMNVSRAGKNLLDTLQHNRKDLSHWSATNGTISVSTVASSNSTHVWFLQVFPAGTYTISCNYSGEGSIGPRLICSKQIDDGTWNNSYHGWWKNFKDESCSFTAEESFAIGLVFISRPGHYGESCTFFDVQLELGSTASDYELYSGNTYPVTWQTEAGTVYGGYVDLITGVLTVTQYLASATKSDFGNKTVPTEGGIPYRQTGYKFPPSDAGTNWNKARQQQLFNYGMVANPWSETSYGDYVGIIIQQSSGLNSYMRISEAVYEKLGDNDTATISFRLITPLTYQLTSTEVKTILGQNYIFADIGNVEVTYRADTKLFCQKNDTVDDVQINGISVLSNGIANVPAASATAAGVVKIPGVNYGIGKMGDGLTIYSASAVDIDVKTGTQGYKPITPFRQHESVFYGLAKLAGVDMASSSNPIGTYTDAAKVAIQKMLGIYEAPWELIREDTFTNTEEGDHIITVDGNGQPFELTDARILFWSPKQDTQFTKGDYGRISFYYSNNSYFSIFAGAYTQAANVSARYTYGLIEQDNGMITKLYMMNTASGDNGNLRVYSQPDGMFKIAKNVLFFNKIVITSVTGTGMYRLYGKRKWT